jgi:hypothetical protein
MAQVEINENDITRRRTIEEEAWRQRSRLVRAIDHAMLVEANFRRRQVVARMVFYTVVPVALLSASLIVFLATLPVEQSVLAQIASSEATWWVLLAALLGGATIGVLSIARLQITRSDWSKLSEALEDGRAILSRIDAALGQEQEEDVNDPGE